MTEMVTVGVDGSDDSLHALRWATDEAVRREVGLQVVYCLHVPRVAQLPYAGPHLQEDSYRDYANSIVDAAASVAAEVAPELDLRTLVLTRPPSNGLLEVSTDASLVVLGSRGLGSLDSLFLGSVSTRVSARAACPTVVVPVNGAHRNTDGPIVVGVDGSAHSDAALRFALGQSALHARPLKIVHGHHRGHGSDHTETDPDSVVADALDRARRDEFADARPETVVLDANSADAVVAASHGASMTVVGSRGRGGFAGMLLGSVSQSVLHRTENPVAIVHASHGKH